MKTERFSREAAADSGIKLFGCRIRAPPERRVPAQPVFTVAQGCSGIRDVESGIPRHACRSLEVRGRREVPSGEDSEAEAIDHEQAKNFKKPDKIIPCPRCNSLETKFCYFNNYNVNQPRHFCRNCQRYWTAGGTMRNVPVGAGRRKNKQLPFQYCQMVASATPKSANQMLCSIKESSPGVLKFAPETSMSKSIETLLAAADNKEESASCGSSITVNGVRGRTPKDGQPNTCNNDDSTHSSCCGSVQACFVPLNQLWKPASLGGQYVAGPMLAVPGFPPQTIPLQIVAAPYMGCISIEAASQGFITPPSLQNGSSPNHSALGKHPRDAGFDYKDTEDRLHAPRALKVSNLNDQPNLRPWTAIVSSNPE
ncbi:hypothetical protein MLD38_025942 [Melastoma candidum]|uniref:Uncharacterized protein n=1 Tax=Melastoma candidum TaxID=119954 RepID=A0ACB9NYS9_9MYRT|nr:hypothetical protein MLD38_025942 [Melastoma candidum]